ncbi:hypothetical protein SAMN05421837_11926 [Amycolatopsis pretoriensis]|uniref:Uncharacterized protein n=1 Tax=Amycolatopsis pretoriensis TaxID=218821 RepID=A0A1H5RIK4_9PSEU|nr:hypothetical protein [Amycolatopsis pretoriensis]SEF38192.1 hypothetical protein SAMN05421837_11926 [Amycolatopsis pretoriensis]
MTTSVLSGVILAVLTKALQAGISAEARTLIDSGIGPLRATVVQDTRRLALGAELYEA